MENKNNVERELENVLEVKFTSYYGMRFYESSNMKLTEAEIHSLSSEPSSVWIGNSLYVLPESVADTVNRKSIVKIQYIKSNKCR